jgi:hypothetical protein
MTQFMRPRVATWIRDSYENADLKADPDPRSPFPDPCRFADPINKMGMRVAQSICRQEHCVAGSSYVDYGSSQSAPARPHRPDDGESSSPE